MLESEREKTTKLETGKKQLEAEAAHRAKLEQTVSTQKSELSIVKDRNIKLERDYNKAMKDLKDREWEVKQLESKQDKTIVEHVHVLEEAKRVTDRQLADAQLELQNQRLYISSLEKSKARLTGEAEDLVRQTELGLRGKDKALKAEEERTAKARAEAEKERHEKDIAETETRRLQRELQNAERRASEFEQELILVQRSKDNLETELERLANETQAPTSMAKVQRQYESQIAQLEDQLNEAESSKALAAKIRDRVERHHQELRQLVMNSGPVDSSFQSRLLQELKAADDDLDREMSLRSRNVSSNSAGDVHNIANITPRKGVHRPRNDSHPDGAHSSTDRQVNALKQQVQFLEIQMVASERVRQHLEASIRDMTADLENSDGSKQSLQTYRARLAKENVRLGELLREEAEARRAAESAQVDGIQTMWTKFQNTISEERQNYSRLEESRKALLIQQRTVQAELEAQRAQLRDLTESRRRMEAEADDLRSQVSEAKAETSNVRRQLQKRLQEEDLSSSTSDAAQSEMRALIESYNAKEQTYQERFEASEIERAKAARAEAFVRRSLGELQKANADTLAQHQALQERLKASEHRAQELQARLDDEGHGSSDLVVINQRLVEELEDEKARHQKDLEESDFTGDQTRKKYQAELAQLSEELQSQRDSMSRLREENRNIRSDYDELQLTFDEEVYNSGGWKKEKERVETKINDITKAYEASTAAQTEQQSQIVTLHGQVRKLRSMLDDVEADRALLQKARRALQAELEGIKIDHVDTNRMSTDREYQKLQLKKQDLERALEEQGDRVTNAFERMKKAEALANEFQIKLSKSRVDYSELERLNVRLLFTYTGTSF
ncbi:hypothetical protein F5146DRAFT_680611 [Armillaria mellea]|nr:hypothetical protein F5146DRAFT_680611 [Armillaria mellea]